MPLSFCFPVCVSCPINMLMLLSMSSTVQLKTPSPVALCATIKQHFQVAITFFVFVNTYHDYYY